jgi:hypothetical protein
VRSNLTDLPTSIQFGLGVAIGHLVIQARKDGASDDELIATLRNTIRILEDNKAIGRELAARPALTSEEAALFRHAVEQARADALRANPCAETTVCRCPRCGQFVNVRLLGRGRVRAVCQTLDCLSLLQ